VAEAVARGQTVIAETCPHYLAVHKDHPQAMLAKYNPAIKEEQDVAGLWDALRDGWVSTVGSDHIPVRLRDKDPAGKDIWTVRGGSPGSGTILPVLLSEGVAKGRITLEKVAEVSSYNAARLFGLYPRKGLIVPGADADLVVVDVHKTMTMQPALLGLDIALTSGWEMTGWPVMTLVRGQVVAEDGQVVAMPGAGRYVRDS
jgi:dihydropyrimidinase